SRPRRKSPSSPASQIPASLTSSPAGPNRFRNAPIACAPPIGNTETRSARRSRPRRSASASTARWSLSPSTSTTARGRSPPAKARLAATRAATSGRDRGCSFTVRIFATVLSRGRRARPGDRRANAVVDDVLPGLNDALKAINRGDVEPAVDLLDPDVDWRGRPRGHLWWRQTPSCHGPDEARRNLALQVDKGQARPG